ncbi:Rnase H [Vibrio phage D528]|nr:putative ribonuclease H [Vibrio phage 144E46.1]
MKMRKPIKVYTDGSSSPHEKDPAKQFGGWAIVVVTENKDYVYYGQNPAPATNNIAEMTALACALDITRDVLAKTFTDNEYAIKSLMEWRTKWESQGMPPKNRDLIRHLWRIFDERTAPVDVKWIKGHVGHYYNEMADQYAKKGKLGDLKSGSLGRVAYKGFKTPENFHDFVQQKRS